MEPRPIAELGAGLGMAHGKLGGAPLLRSPLQGRECVYYFFRVVQPEPGGKERRLATGKQWTLANVSDASGRAEIEAVPALVASPRRHAQVFRGIQTIPEGLAPFFEAAGIDQKHLGRLSHFVAYEYTLEPGDDVFVTGEVRRQGDGKVFYRTRYSPLIVSAEPDIGLLPGLRTEFFVHAALTALLLVGAAALAALGLT